MSLAAQQTRAPRLPAAASRRRRGSRAARRGADPGHAARVRTREPTAAPRRRPLRHGAARRAPEPSIVGAFAMRGDLVVLRAPTPAGEPPTYTALGPWWAAARWTEQELADRYDARPLGLIELPDLTRPDPDALDHAVEGLDVFSLPFGPVRSGVFEAIQFLIETGGEDVTRVRTRPFFKHRGLEQRVVGHDAQRGGARGRADRRGLERRPRARVLPGGRAGPRRRAAASRGAVAGRPRRARADGQPSRRDRQAGRDDRPVGRPGPLSDPQGAGHAPPGAAHRQPLRSRRARARRGPRRGADLRPRSCSRRSTRSSAT